MVVAPVSSTRSKPQKPLTNWRANHGSAMEATHFLERVKDRRCQRGPNAAHHRSHSPLRLPVFLSDFGFSSSSSLSPMLLLAQASWECQQNRGGVGKRFLCLNRPQYLHVLMTGSSPQSPHFPRTHNPSSEPFLPFLVVFSTNHSHKFSLLSLDLILTLSFPSSCMTFCCPSASTVSC